MALKSEKNGINRCPNCGSSDVKLDVKTGKLKCNFCKSEFEGKKANARGGVEKLKGETVSGGAELIIPDEKVIVTLKCPACGAEVVINTDESVSARCHWCRHTLSLNEKMKPSQVWFSGSTLLTVSFCVSPVFMEREGSVTVKSVTSTSAGSSGVLPYGRSRPPLK